MISRLRTTLTLLALLFLLATSASWISSHFRATSVYAAREWFADKNWSEHFLSLTTESGGLHFIYTCATTTEADVNWGTFPQRTAKWRCDAYTSPTMHYPALTDEVAPGHTSLGFAFGSNDGFIHAAWRQGHQWELIFPCSALWLLSATLTAIFFRSYFHDRRRHQPGHCPQCSYDVRAHHPGRKCPECGSPIPLPPPSSPAPPRAAS